MKDERAHLQLFDLVAREWRVSSVVRQIAFNASDSAVAFACEDGSVHLSMTADKSSPNIRTRRAVDDGRLTIAPRSAPVVPLKAADFTAGRSSALVPFGPLNFAFAKADGRINSLTPGGIAVHLPARADSAIPAIAASPDGSTVAFASGARIALVPAGSATPRTLEVDHPVTALAFSADGLLLAAAHATGVSCWTVADPDQAPLGFALSVTPVSVIWHRDGAWLLCCLDAGGIALINRVTGAVRQYDKFPAPVRSAAFSAPTGTVVAAGAFRVAGWSLDGDGPDVVTGKPGLLLVDAIATCPTRNLVAVGYANGLVSLAEIGRPSEMLLREDTGANVTAMAWSGNGSFLALAGSDGSAALVEFPDSMFKS